MSQDEGAIAASSAAWVERMRSGSRLRDVVDGGHQLWVAESTERALAEHADVLQRLKDYDGDAGADVEPDV